MFYLILPIILSSIALIGFILWQYYGFVADTYPPIANSVTNPGCFHKCIYKCVPTEYDVTKVTSISMKAVITETIFLFAGCASMCLWLIFYADCHTPQYNYCRLPN